MKLQDSQTNFGTRRGISGTHHQALALLHRKASDPFPVGVAAELLGLSLPQTRRFLAHLAAGGWLVRVRRGLYAVVPLETREPETWQVDPWAAALEVFAPCYIGGWSACEHWGLTDQVFRKLVVMTARRVPRRDVELQATPLRLKHVPEDRHFGLVPVWRGQVRVPVSDPTRTVVDLLDDPALVGGLRHGAEVLTTWFQDHGDEARLLEYAERLGNRTVFKRLGYLLERLDLGSSATREACLERLSAGYGLLDPSAPPRGPRLARWRLRLNVTLEDRGGEP